MKLSELTEKTDSKIEQGDENLEINSAAGLDIAEAGQITFLANLKYTPQVKNTKASAIFLSEGVEIERENIAILRAKDAYISYTLALREFHPMPEIVPSIHKTACRKFAFIAGFYKQIQPHDHLES